MMNLLRLNLWPLRILWILAPLLIGVALKSNPYQTNNSGEFFFEIYMWLLWFVVLIALLTPSAVSLTAIRTLIPMSALTCLISLTSLRQEVLSISALGLCAVITVLTFSPSVGDQMINGSAYGSERRMALRTPTVMTIFIPIIWAVLALLVFLPLFFVYQGQTFLAFLSLVIGAPFAWLGARSLHQFSKRWIVFVPAGFVLHDHLLLSEPILFHRKKITKLHVAESKDLQQEDTLDIARLSTGLALRVETNDSMKIVAKKQGQSQPLETSAVLFTPSLPGVVLKEARVRAINTN